MLCFAGDDNQFQDQTLSTCTTTLTMADDWGTTTETNGGGWEDEAPAKRRSPSPREERRRSRSFSPPRRRGPPPRPRRDDGNPPAPTNVLGVFGLSLRTVEADLQDAFGAYGTIEKVVIVYDNRSQRSRGFGFIYFPTVEEATKARDALNGIDLHGRQIRVDYSKTERPHTPTPGEYMGTRRDDRYGGGGRGGFRSPPRHDRYGGGGRGGDRYDHYAPDRDRYRGGGDRYGDRDRDRGYGRDRGDRDRGDRYEPRDRDRSPPPRRRRSPSPRDRSRSPPPRRERSRS